MCANGVIYCRLLEQSYPGTLDMSKVNTTANAEHHIAANYRMLQAALEKLESVDSKQLEVQNLSKAQPTATLGMLHRLYALAELSSTGVPSKGLAPLDPNAIDARSRGKRRAVDAVPPPPAKRPEVDAAAAGGESATAPPAEGSVEAVLRAQLEEVRAQLVVSREETRHLREEVEFYMTKLELIDLACTQSAPDGLAQSVQRLLYADEAEIAAEVIHS